MTTVGEEIWPAGVAIGLQSGRERSLKGREFPDGHLIGAAELAGGGIGVARSGGGNGRNSVIERFRRRRGRKVAGGGREYTLEARRSCSCGGRQRSTAIGGGRR